LFQQKHVSALFIIYLGLPLPESLYRPTRSASERATLRRCRQRNLFGLSIHEVYPAPAVASGAVSSYLAFSPFPFSRKKKVVYFLWHFLYSASAKSFPLGSMALCIARTFLPVYFNEAMKRSAQNKNSVLLWTIPKYIF
jgi:hypothetical protein